MPHDPKNKLFSTRILWSLLGLSAVVICFLAFHLFDTCLSLDYARSGARGQLELAKTSIEVVRHLVIDTPKSKVEEMAAEFSKQGEIVKTHAGEIQIGDIIFHYSAEKITSVTYLNERPSK